MAPLALSLIRATAVRRRSCAAPPRISTSKGRTPACGASIGDVR